MINNHAADDRVAASYSKTSNRSAICWEIKECWFPKYVVCLQSPDCGKMSVWCIVKNIFRFQTLVSRWVPRFLTVHPITFQKISMWIQCTTARSFASWKRTSVTRSLIWGMSRFSLYMILPTFFWVHNILWQAWLVYFSTSGLFASFGTQWCLVIPASQSLCGWRAFCKWLIGEMRSCNIFLWLSNKLLCYGNWTFCRSTRKISILTMIMLKNRSLM